MTILSTTTRDELWPSGDLSRSKRRFSSPALPPLCSCDDRLAPPFTFQPITSPDHARPRRLRSRSSPHLVHFDMHGLPPTPPHSNTTSPVQPPPPLSRRHRHSKSSQQSFLTAHTSQSEPARPATPPQGEVFGKTLVKSPSVDPSWRVPSSRSSTSWYHSIVYKVDHLWQKVVRETSELITTLTTYIPSSFSIQAHEETETDCSKLATTLLDHERHKKLVQPTQASDTASILTIQTQAFDFPHLEKRLSVHERELVDHYELKQEADGVEKSFEFVHHAFYTQKRYTLSACVLLALSYVHAWGCLPDQERGMAMLYHAMHTIRDAAPDFENLKTSFKGLMYLEIAHCWLYGWGTKKHHRTAIHYFEQAAALNDVDALQMLLTIYQRGTKQIKKNKAKAEYYQRRLQDVISDYLYPSNTLPSVGDSCSIASLE